MKISELLDKNTIELDLKAKKMKNPQNIVAVLLEREKASPSAFENGVAIPHATIEGIKEVVACLAISRSGIDFESPDKRPVRVIFLLLSPLEESETHLQILSKAEGLLQNKKLCDALITSYSKEKLINEIINAERMGWDMYINLSKEDVLLELGTTERGLSREEAKRRLQRYGSNLLEKIRKKPLLLRISANLTNLLAILLWVAGILAFMANLPELAWAILAVIFINALFSFWQEYKAEKAIEALRELIPSYSRVLRDSKEDRILTSEIGKIARVTQVIKEELSPLQREMIKVTKVVSILAISMGILFFILGSYVVHLTTFESFIFAIGIIVANVPEGLLPTVSLALAMAVQRMAKRHVIIRRLSSVETLGCTTVICTDKTGTLTTNQISVVRLWFNNSLFKIEGSGYDPSGQILYNGSPLSREEIKKSGMEALIKIGVTCNRSELLAPSNEKPFWSIAGDPTEGALLVLAKKAGFDYKDIKDKNPRIFQLSFDSVRKRMSTINLIEGHNILANVKGAPSEVLSLCNSVYVDGKKEPLTDEIKTSILKHLDNFASEGLRVLGLAYGEVEKK